MPKKSFNILSITFIIFKKIENGVQRVIIHNIELERLKELCKLLTTNKTLKILNIKSKEPNLKEISEALKKNNTLEELFLEDCSIKDDQLKFLSQMLRENKSLKVLNLNYNYIGYQGM
jgi:hypothetical protein